ncbi:MAG: hypothetical protein V8T45_08550 [Oscillospiraceae bacterium]
MALDKEYFDSIDINIVRQKYYNANKVNSVLEDIRRQAEAMTEENRQLKEQLSELGQGKSQIGDTLLTAQAAARDIVAKAKIQAAKMGSGRRLSSSGRAPPHRSGGPAGVRRRLCVRKAFDKIVHQQLESIELLNGMWQEFLCGLVTEGPEARAVKGPGPVKPQPTDKEAKPPKPVPGDKERIGQLESMVNNIARELSEIMGDRRDEECKV